MVRIEEKAPAKVNLALHVLGRRGDGYHELDSIVAFLPQVADEVLLQPAPAPGIEVNGPYAAAVPLDERNLALHAARIMIGRWPQHFAAVHILLRKNLPVAAGIGGGSADAAAVIRGMCRLFGFTPPREELHALALELGADVPVCLQGRASRMRGIGERLQPLAMPPGMHLLLINPGIALSTADVFQALHAGPVVEKRAIPPRHLPDRLVSVQGWAHVLAALRNDLEPVACRLAPEVERCLTWLKAQPGVKLVRMSGSGATCLALFFDAQAAHDAHVRSRQHAANWWTAIGEVA